MYAEQVTALAAQGVSVDEAIRVITTDDVRDAADLFKPVYDDTDGVDGRVSIEVEPGLARDTEKTITQAKELWAIVGRENVFIKIPATQEGLPAITATLAEGISVNVTLIFSLDRYKAVADAFLTGLEKALDNGHDVTKLGSVASFFVSRVDTEVDKRLDAHRHRLRRCSEGAQGQGRDRQRPARLRGVRGDLQHGPLARARDRRRQAAASALGLDRRQGPVVPGHHVRRPAGHVAAWSTRCRRQRSTPSPTTARSPATPSAAATTTARKVIADLEQLGISYDEVVQVLEDEGVSKFEASWAELQDTVSAAAAAASKGAAK